MSKNLFLTFTSFVLGLLMASSAMAQGAAETGETLNLNNAELLSEEAAESTSPQKTEAISNVKSTQPLVANKTGENTPSTALSKEASKKLARQAKVEKFLKSKTGQWIIKRAAIKAHKKQVRKQLKALKGDKEARKALKEKSKKEVVEIKAVNSNVRTGIILIAAGIILTILPVDIIRVVGSILIVIGLVFIILGLI